MYDTVADGPLSAGAQAKAEEAEKKEEGEKAEAAAVEPAAEEAKPAVSGLLTVTSSAAVNV